MTPDELAMIGTRLHGPRWQRALARTLDALAVEGLATDPDGRRMRRWASGDHVIPDAASRALRSLLRQVEKLPPIEKMIATVRLKYPRASLLYALILLRLEREGGRGLPQAALCVDYADNPNNSAISTAVRNLESLGFVKVDRGRQTEGNTVRLVRDPRVEDAA